MTTNIYAVNAPSKQIKQLLARFPEMFLGSEAELRLHVPPGWLDILQLALEDATSNATNIQICKLYVQAGALAVEFTSGSSVAQKAFQELLLQTGEYCPCCGSLWSTCAKTQAGVE